MARRASVAVLLLALLSGAPAAAGSTLEEDLAPFIQAAHRAAGTMVGAAEDAARRTGDAAGALGGPAKRLVDEVVPLVGVPGQSGADTYLGIGEGSTVVNLTHSEHTCPAMRALIAFRRPVSNEFAMVYDFHGSPAAPAAVCAAGWRGGFELRELQGDEQRGWTGRIRSIDADVDMVIGAPRGDGTRTLWLRQVTFPQGSGNGFGHVLQFTGLLADVA